MTTFCESVTPGSSRTREPVAMIAFANVCVSVVPSAFATSIVLASRNVPLPSTSVMPFFFMRKCTPLTCFSDTWRLRSNATPKSKDASPTMPNWAAWSWKMCASSALRRSAFEGGCSRC